MQWPKTIWVGLGLILFQVIVITLYMFYVVSTASDEHVMSHKSDLEKYPEIQLFIHGMVDFMGELSDIERGTVRFKYVTTITNGNGFFGHIDEALNGSGWTMLYSNGVSRTYQTNLLRYPAQNRADTVMVTYDEKTCVVQITWE